MKRNSIIFLFLLFFLHACNSDKKPSGQSENEIDAARNFIRAALDGKFDEARTFLLPDSVNTNFMDVAERSYMKTDDDTKRSYRSSSINIHQVKSINDSTTVVIYSNSFKNDHDTLKVLKQNGQWLVDFKYLYEHDMDTVSHQSINKNSIK
jgi:type IV secretory pathway component VirB8